MNDLIPAIVCAIVFYYIYKIIELFVKKKERMTIIEKFSSGIDPEILQTPMYKPLIKNENNSIWSIRSGLLLLGVGLGLTLAVIFHLSGIPRVAGTQEYYDYQNTVSILYPAFAIIFGGLGLVIAYFIERKDNKKAE